MSDPWNIHIIHMICLYIYLYTYICTVLIFHIIYKLSIHVYIYIKLYATYTCISDISALSSEPPFRSAWTPL